MWLMIASLSAGETLFSMFSTRNQVPPLMHIIDHFLASANVAK